MSRYRDPQFQVGENYSYLINLHIAQVYFQSFHWKFKSCELFIEQVFKIYWQHLMAYSLWELPETVECRIPLQRGAILYCYIKSTGSNCLLEK